GQALFHAPTRQPVGFEEIIRQYAKIGIGHWATHDTDVIPAASLDKPEQGQIVERIQETLKANGVACSMVTTNTFFHAVGAFSIAVSRILLGMHLIKRCN
ncbi:MAG: hypothetical protein ACR2NN_06635, partial [Bryobacteraceae bacterium]